MKVVLMIKRSSSSITVATFFLDGYEAVVLARRELVNVLPSREQVVDALVKSEDVESREAVLVDTPTTMGAQARRVWRSSNLIFMPICYIFKLITILQKFVAGCSGGF